MSFSRLDCLAKYINFSFYQSYSIYNLLKFSYKAATFHIFVHCLIVYLNQSLCQHETAF